MHGVTCWYLTQTIRLIFLHFSFGFLKQVHLFHGGVGWKQLDLGVSTVPPSTRRETTATTEKEESDHNILNIRLPTLFKSSLLVTIDSKMKTKQKNMIKHALKVEMEGRESWGEAVSCWQETIYALLKRGQLHMYLEIEVLDRLMALERGRNRLHECLKFHDRAIRVCINMKRSGDFKGIRPEIIDRWQLYKRRRMLLREFMRYRLVDKRGTYSRLVLNEDRQRRVAWWGIRQMFRSMGRHYQRLFHTALRKEQQMFDTWSTKSGLSLEAHVAWSKARIQSQHTYSLLVSEGGEGIGAFMASIAVHGSGSSSGGGRKVDPDAKPPPSSIVRNLFYANALKARKDMDLAYAKNTALACELEQLTIELEKARSHVRSIADVQRRCRRGSLFTVSVRTNTHTELSQIVPPLR